MIMDRELDFLKKEPYTHHSYPGLSGSRETR
jgi:hypothetical protein